MEERVIQVPPKKKRQKRKRFKRKANQSSLESIKNEGSKQGTQRGYLILA